MIKKIFFVCSLSFFVYGDVIPSDITLDFIKQHPRSITKDFYIWQYLNQDITPQEAIIALSEINTMNNNLFFRYAKKSGHDETYAVAQCMQASAKDLLEQNDHCIEAGLTYPKALNLNYSELGLVTDKLSANYPLKTEALKVINSSLPFVKLVSVKPDVFFEVFNKTSKDFRYDKLNYKLPQGLIDKVKDDIRFNQSIKLIVTDLKLKNLQNSLIGIDDSKLNFQSSFYLALNVLLNSEDNKELAMNYLNNASKKAYFKIDKDMVLLWQYFVSEDISYIETLAQSWDINIYSIYAKEKLSLNIDNALYSLETNQDLAQPVLTQFDWVNILQSNLKLDENVLNDFSSKLSKHELPHLVYLYHKFHNYRQSVYITPYEDLLKNSSPERKSLIYSIARQESGFVPTLVSTSYALGAMQIMPFLADSLSKQLGENIYLEDMFKPEVNIKYANKHLDYLESKLQHPLYISYAYNGGIGFTNREVLYLFKEQLPFNPFMAMELVPYDESKQYGKKVLANYYIYLNYIKNEKVSLNSLLEGLR